MKTWLANKEEAKRDWVIYDAAGKTLGRLATEVASSLRGKNKPTFTPHVDNGEFVIVINTDKLKFTGNKLENKNYFWHTGFVGGIKSRTAAELMVDKSDEVFKRAVRGMLPKNRLNNKIIKKLKIYRGSEHTHSAQNPRAIG